jgi:hypothetical protein
VRQEAGVIEELVSACDAMLVLIGPDWLTANDETGVLRQPAGRR